VLPDEAITFQIAMQPMQTGDIWIDGQHSALGAAAVDTFLFDLTSRTYSRRSSTCGSTCPRPP
jgi:hypothetical protein